MRILPILLVLVSCLHLAPTRAAEAPPYPRGASTQTHDEMEFSLVLPTDYDSSRKYPLLIALHGQGGKGSDIAAGFADMAREGFVICAPQSSALGWDQPNVDRAKAILRHLLDVLSIDPKKLHGAAYSQACPLLSSIVFDKRFHFISATWGMGGSAGGKVPRWARKEMGVFVMVGSEDWARGAAEGTVSLLAKKVRTVECHVQMGLGHEFPIKLIPYHRYWLKVMNGWFVPGECGFFDWTDDVAAAKATMSREKRGAMLYFYSEKDGENGEARRVQNEVFFDPLVRHFGRQAATVKLEREAHRELFASLNLTETPAVVVLSPDFEAKMTLQGARVKGSTLGKALRGVVRNRRMPDEPGVFLHR